MRQLSQGHHISLDLADPLPPVQGDADCLQQVLLTIGDNALKFTPQEESICLSAQTDGKRIMIMVQDDGCGIPTDDLLHIFDRFYRVDQAGSRTLNEKGGDYD